MKTVEERVNKAFIDNEEGKSLEQYTIEDHVPPPSLHLPSLETIENINAAGDIVARKKMIDFADKKLLYQTQHEKSTLILGVMMQEYAKFLIESLPLVKENNEN